MTGLPAFSILLLRKLVHLAYFNGGIFIWVFDGTNPAIITNEILV